MDTKQLKNAFIVRVVIYAVFVISAAAILFYLNTTMSEAYQKRDWLKNDIRSLTSKLEGLNQKTLEFSEAVRIWKSLTPEQARLSGLRINDAKDMLDEFQKAYNLTEVNTSFSKPEELEGKLKSETVTVVSSTVTISFKGLTDESIFQFLEALSKKFPGYVQIKSFSLTLGQDVTKDMLTQIAKGETPPVVQGAIEFWWRDLKYEGPKAVEGSNAGGNNAPGQGN